VRQACREQNYYDLLDWFACVEMLAWVKVNAYFEDNRPDRIFLVTGQALTAGYAISHKGSMATDCEVVLSASADIPTAVKASALAQYNIERAYAAMGFEEVKSREDGKEYAIFLDARYSAPIRRFRLRSFKQRVEDMYRYYCGRRVKTNVGQVFFGICAEKAETNSNCGQS